MAWEPQEITRWERHLKTMVRSASENDPEAFAELVKLADCLSREGLPTAYAGMRRNGYSRKEIAAPLGVSHQAAYERFQSRPRKTGYLTGTL